MDESLAEVGERKDSRIRELRKKSMDTFCQNLVEKVIPYVDGLKEAGEKDRELSGASASLVFRPSLSEKREEPLYRVMWLDTVRGVEKPVANFGMEAVQLYGLGKICVCLIDELEKHFEKKSNGSRRVNLKVGYVSPGSAASPRMDYSSIL